MKREKKKEARMKKWLLDTKFKFTDVIWISLEVTVMSEKHEERPLHSFDHLAESKWKKKEKIIESWCV